MRYLITISVLILFATAAYAHPPQAIRAPATRMVQERVIEEPGPSDAPRRTITQEPDTEVTIPGERRVIETPDTTVRVPGRKTIIDELPPKRFTRQETIIEDVPARVVRRAAPVFVEEYFVDYYAPAYFAAPAYYAAPARRGIFPLRRGSVYRSRTVERGFMW